MSEPQACLAGVPDCYLSEPVVSTFYASAQAMKSDDRRNVRARDNISLHAEYLRDHKQASHHNEWLSHHWRLGTS